MSKVKIQDIADRSGLSRNTVSKIFNGKYTGPEETRQKVLKMAVDMKYKEYGQLELTTEDKASPKEMKNILLLSKGDAVASNFFAHIVDAIQKRTEGEGYNLLISSIRENDIETMQLPPAIRSGVVDGIVCMELFDKNYIEKLIALGIPTVFVEFYWDAWDIPGKYDVILMNNEYQVNRLTASLIKDGCKNIGFIGDYRHCRGFYERYTGYANAMRSHNLAIDPKYSITVKDGDNYFDIAWLADRLAGNIPHAFVCVNDAIAVNVVKAVRQLGYSIPGDVQVTSFDDIPDATNILPALTTVRIFKEELGKCATESLLARIDSPDRQKQLIYVDTEIVLRDSTRKTLNWL